VGELPRESNPTDHIRFIHELRRDDENAKSTTTATKKAKQKQQAVEEDDPEEVNLHDEYGGQRQHGRVPEVSREHQGPVRNAATFMHRHLNDKIIIEEEGELRDA
jgi:hypothetical protein